MTDFTDLSDPYHLDPEKGVVPDEHVPVWPCDIDTYIAAITAEQAKRLTVDDCPVCPDCVQGKHGNCDGSTWNNTADQMGACPCAQKEHTP